MGGLLDLSGALHPKAYGGYLVGIATQKIRRNFSQHQCWESRSQNGSVLSNVVDPDPYSKHGFESSQVNPVLRSRHFFGRLRKSRGPGADSGFGSDQIGSAPAPGKKGGSRLLRLHKLNFFILSSFKVNFLMQVFFGTYLPILNCS